MAIDGERSSVGVRGSQVKQESNCLRDLACVAVGGMEDHGISTVGMVTQEGKEEKTRKKEANMH